MSGPSLITIPRSPSLGGGVSAPEKERVLSAANRSHSVLVVEDELIIAMDIASLLESEGFDVMPPAPSVEQALRALGNARPDIVILDMNLRGEIASPVALLLREMGVPFVVVSAQSRKRLLELPAIEGAPFLDKPISQVDLLRELRGLLAA